MFIKMYFHDVKDAITEASPSVANLMVKGMRINFNSAMHLTPFKSCAEMRGTMCTNLKIATDKCMQVFIRL